MKLLLRFYLDTSFWDRLTDNTSPRRRRLSFRFLSHLAGRHELFVSELVRREVAHTPDPAERRLIRRRMDAARPRVLTCRAQAEAMARELLSASGRGEKVFADFVHVGYTVISGADALVTWDRDDLACPRMRSLVQWYARRRGQPAPVIGTPEEVAEWFGLRTHA
ncbi:MAG: hypothetical protein HYY93_02690 [Planctomycetes bacterium]|nr:hypothetical protein [Planctomycetota bacterium]